MASIPDREIAGAASAAGFTGKSLVTAIAVALAESGGDPGARNPSGAAGLWQILPSAHPDLFAQYTWSDPADNAVMARHVYVDAGNSWRPWVAYTTGKHLGFVGRAKRAAGNPVASSGSPSVVPAATTGVGASFAWFMSPNTWIRAGLFLVGGLLLVWSLLSFTTLDNAVAKLAITKGVIK